MCNSELIQCAPAYSSFVCNWSRWALWGQGAGLWGLLCQSVSPQLRWPVGSRPVSAGHLSSRYQRFSDLCCNTHTWSGEFECVCVLQAAAVRTAGSCRTEGVCGWTSVAVVFRWRTGRWRSGPERTSPSAATPGESNSFIHHPGYLKGRLRWEGLSDSVDIFLKYCPGGKETVNINRIAQMHTNCWHLLLWSHFY